MNRREIKLLQGMQSYPSVSILMPTHRIYSEGQEDRIRLGKLADQVRNRLAGQGSETLLENLSSLIDDVDYRRLTDGLALFATGDFARKFLLPIAPRERVVVSDRFDIRELLLATERNMPYWVLVVTEPRIRLLRGQDGDLAEVEAEGFPMEHFVAEAPEERLTSSAVPGGGSWYPGRHSGPGAHAPLPGGYAPDPSKFRDEHLRQFLRDADRNLSSALDSEKLPLIVAGTERMIALFKESSSRGGEAIGFVAGSFDKTWAQELPSRCQTIARDHNVAQRKDMLLLLAESVSTNRYASGIKEVWQLAADNRCRTLFVESDYFCPAVLQAGGRQIEPVENGGGKDVVDDAVNVILHNVLDSGGEAVFVDPGELGDYGHIAAILRY